MNRPSDPTPTSRLSERSKIQSHFNPTLKIWMLPLAVFCLLALVNLLLWSQTIRLSRDIALMACHDVAQQTSLRLENFLNERDKDIALLAALWTNYPPANQANFFLRDATQIINREPNYYVINFIDTQSVVRFSAPVGRRPDLINRNMRSLPNRAMLHKQVFQTMQPSVSPPLTLTTGQLALIIWHPIPSPRSRQQAEGMIAGVLEMDKLVAKTFLPDLLHDFTFALYINNQLIHASPARAGNVSFKKATATATLNWLGQTMRIQILPSANSRFTRHSHANLILFGVSFLLTGLAAGLLWFALLSFQRFRASQRSLWQSESRYRAVFNGAGDMTWIQDLEGKILDVNKMLCQQTGYTRQELLSLQFNDIIAADCQPNFQTSIHELQNHKYHIFESSLLSKTNACIPIEANVRRIYFGRQPAILCIARDIIDRVQTQELLKLQRNLALVFSTADSLEECLNTLLEMVTHIPGIDSGGVYLVNTDGSFQLTAHRGLSAAFIKSASTYTNNSPNVQLAMRGEAVYGQYLKILPEPRDVDYNEQLRALAVIPVKHQEKVIALMNLASHRHDHIPLNARHALESLAAQIGATIVRLRAEEALRKSEERMELALQGAGLALLDWNLRTDEFYFNPRWAEMLGYAMEELEPHIQTMQDLMHPSDWERILPQLHEHLEGKTGVYQTEIRLRTKSGQWKWVFERAKVVERDAQGTPLRMVGTQLDITERKQSEESLKEAIAEVEKANLELEHAVEETQRMALKAASADAAKSEFLANMSHEIRTPMNGIIGFTDILLDDEVTAEQRHALESIQSNANTLMTLINDILDLSKVEAGQIELENIPFNLENLVYQVCELIRAKAGRKPVEVLCDLPNLPSPLIGDPTRLQQVLLNLLDNALKFTPAGEICATVQILEAESDRMRIEFQVMDTGIGIPHDKLQAIFKPFTQVDGSTSRLFGGTGLGLTICQQLVQLMGGRLGVKTKINTGSVFGFSVWFPTSPETRIPELSPEISAQLQGQHALIIDDNFHSLRIAETMLSAWGITCTIQPTVDQALESLRQETFKVLLLDTHIPNSRRLIEAWQKIKDANRPGLIGMVATVSRRGNRSLYEAFDRILFKPLRRSNVLAALLGLAAIPAEVKIDPQPARSNNALLQPQNVKILLVDDNLDNLQIMSKMLQHMGYKLDVARDGKQAIKMAKPGRYHVIFMDIQMPTLGGLEATQILRENGLTTPIIALTAHAMKGDREHCLEAGMTDYLSKPLRRNAVRDVIQRYTGSQPAEEFVSTPRILLVEDDKKLLKNMFTAIQHHLPAATFRVATHGIQACVLLGSFLPDLLVVDCKTPDINIFELMHFMQSDKRYVQIRVIVMNAFAENPAKVEKLREAGARVILTKTMPVTQLLDMIHQMFSKASPPHESEAAVAELSLVHAISAELGITPQDYIEVLEVFVRNTAKKIERLSAAWAENNVKRFGDTAHSIKSSSLSLRLHAVADPAARLEKMANEQAFLDVEGEINLLQHAYAQVEQLLAQHTAGKA